MNRILKQMGLAGMLSSSLALGACSTMGMGSSQTWSMNTAESAQAAVGKVKVANEKDGNTKVKVEVDHLAPPALAAEEGSSYVVWIKPDNGSAQNVGVLKVGSNRKGELKTVTPFKEFTVMVTLEKSPGVTIPSGAPVLDTRITMPT
ncbi:MAG TPA: anti-sigma factor [Polyangia bacterium]|nr:anti-sigma factor [Polyangia bacterium]